MPKEIDTTGDIDETFLEKEKYPNYEEHNQLYRECFKLLMELSLFQDEEEYDSLAEKMKELSHLDCTAWLYYGKLVSQLEKRTGKDAKIELWIKSFEQERDYFNQQFCSSVINAEDILRRKEEKFGEEYGFD